MPGKALLSFAANLALRPRITAADCAECGVRQGLRLIGIPRTRVHWQLTSAEPLPLQSQALGVCVRSRPPFPAETCRHRNLPIPTPSSGPLHRFTAPLVPASWVTSSLFFKYAFTNITPLVEC